MKKSLLKEIWKLSLLLILGLFTFSCDSDDNTVITDSRTIKVADNSTFGKILTDKDGRTLYFFSNDYKGISSCTNGCLDV